MTVYTATARFDGTARALTEDELRAAAPSVFAVAAHESRSERFRPIPTIEIVRELSKEGFVVVGAMQSKTRDASKRDYTKHLLRIRKIDDAAEYNVGGTTSEIILKNANDGTSAYDLMSGLFRIQCLNSLVCQTATIDSVKVRHSGDVAAKVIEGTARVLQESHKALAAPDQWSRIRLDRGEAAILAEAAHELRFGDDEDGEPQGVARAIRPAQLLTPRRATDTEPTLWVAANVIQENIIRGGLRGVAPGPNGVRNHTMRPVKGVDQNVRLNKALWVLNERFAELKGYKLAA